MTDTTDITATPLQQLVLDWAAVSVEEAAAAFEETFTQASILPNATVLRELRSMDTNWPLALMAVNDRWSVYAAGPRWLAVNTDIGEVVAFSDLEPGDIEELGIPMPE